MNPLGTEDLLTGEIASLRREVERLRVENSQLRQREQNAILYIRRKVDQLLSVMGTLPLRPEELDDETLIQLDPIGIISDTFVQILQNLHSTNDKLILARDEIQAILDSAGAGILVLDRRRRVMAYNQKIRFLFLADDVPSILGCNCHDVLCGKDPDHQECVFERVMASGAVEGSLDWQFQERFFNVIGTPVKNSRGEVTHAVLVYTEVTEQKRIEQALRTALDAARDSRERIRAILHSVAEGLLVTDPAGQVMAMNPAAEKLLNCSMTQVQGRHVRDVVPDEGLVALLERSLKGEVAADGVDFSPFKEGEEESVFQGRVSRVRDTCGEVSGAVLVIHDVTRERMIDRMKSEFVSTAAHELRTPLAIILGFSELLMNQERFSSPEQQEYITLINEKAEGLTRIIDDLLDISRIESGSELPVWFEICSLEKLLRNSLSFFEKGAEDHDFELFLPSDPVMLYVDPGGVDQILENIIGNAVKYSPNGGTIRLRAEVQGTFCQLSVEDEGIGMDARVLERVFDKFFRADASNTAVPGTGLGMTIVQHLVEAHGGKVWLESAPGKGTKVFFTLPLAAGTTEGGSSSAPD